MKSEGGQKRSQNNAGILTSRVNPRNTSRECARCHSLVARYEEGKPAEGYTYGAPLVLCHQCGMKGDSDRNASLVIGQRLVARYQKPSKEKPHTPLKAGRVEQSTGVVISQVAKSVGTRPSNGSARRGDHNEHGTAQETGMRMVEPISDIPYQLRVPF
ncbi:MAG TPA: zinc ribbon domain-containing protein [Ktedonobacteraceae bacterium]|nr:zinc ribbon domain-containing protein [Ktedonobacteraceae bacterium]